MNHCLLQRNIGAKRKRIENETAPISIEDTISNEVIEINDEDPIYLSSSENDNSDDEESSTS